MNIAAELPTTPGHPSLVSVDAPAAPGAPAEVTTRDAIVNLLLAQGPITAADLAARLRLSAAGIRRHLDALVDEGAVISREQVIPGRRGRGRPARVYLLTDLGRERLPHGYDTLAAEVLQYLAEHVGPEAVSAFARHRAENLIAAKRDQIAAAVDPAAKVSLLAEALTDGGFAASAQTLGKGSQLCQHHCPVAHVAAQFPQLCEEEMAVFTEVLGTYAQRLATIARGDSFCTTFIPLAAVDTAQPRNQPQLS